MSDEIAPKVFVSYCWTTEEHSNWVLKLCERLRGDAVDVCLDRWDLVEGHDKYAYMERMVSDPAVSKVLILSDKKYAEKANNREGGVGTETLIISPEVYASTSQDKFIPVVCERDDKGKEYLPVYINSRIYIDLSGRDSEKYELEYDKLIRNIFNKPQHVKPPLGKVPSHLLSDNIDDARLRAAATRFRAHALSGALQASGSLRDYCDAFIDSLEQFRITAATHEKPYHEIVLQSIRNTLSFRDSFVDVVVDVARYLDNDDAYDEIRNALQRLSYFQSPPERCVSWSDRWADNYRFIIWELFLYSVACLIRERRYSAAAMIIEEAYLCKETNSPAGLRVFDIYNATLEESARRTVMGRGVSSELLQERATRQKPTFQDLFQVDILLFIRPHFPQPGGASMYWYPRVNGTHWRQSTPLELFMRLGSATGLKPLQDLLRIDSVEDLWKGYEKVMAEPYIVEILTRNDYHALRNFPRLINFDEVKRMAAE